MSLRRVQSELGSAEIALWISEFVLRSEEEAEAMEEAKQGAGG